MGGNGFGYGGNLAVILVYKGVLTQADTIPLKDYLEDKYRPAKP